MNTEFKGTKEKVIADIRSGCCAIYLESRKDEKNGIEPGDERNLFFSDKGCVYNGSHWEMDEETQQNTVVFADGLNTIQSCGLLPSELLKQRDEALELIAELGFLGNWSDKKQKEINDFLVSTEVKP